LKIQFEENVMKRAVTLFAVAAVATTGLATVFAREKNVVAMQAVGKPVDCVSTYQIRDTKIIDDRTIDFKMSGGKTLRNTLPYSCPSLKYEERFSYRLSTGQLCSVDVIRVLNSYGGHLQEGAACGLGQFQPVEKVAP
jgi:hypothetical protein